jgi:hypothetical protein
VSAGYVSVWLADTDGREVSRRDVLHLEPGDVPEITFLVRDPGRPPLKLRSSWRDVSGLHERGSLVKVPRTRRAV